MFSPLKFQQQQEFKNYNCLAEEGKPEKLPWVGELFPNHVFLRDCEHQIPCQTNSLTIT